MPEIECDYCEGKGWYEVMTWLTYEGDMTFRTEECTRCRGSGYVEEEEDNKKDESQQDQED